jgi:transketolase
LSNRPKLRNSFSIDLARQRCKRYRRRILDISQQVGALHAAAAFSAMEMTDCIYHGLINQNQEAPNQDKFIMSKGHGCLVQYVILEDLGVLNREDLDLYCKPNGRLGCHPDYGTPGIEASTGSLGHGLPMATGIAYAAKFIQKSPTSIYIVISDGELQEGSTWEGMMMAANLGVDNLVVCLDHNGMQSFGQTKDTHPKFYPINEKIAAFGWETGEVNGHDSQAIFDAINNRSAGKPFMLVCNTIKGRGVSFMENESIWHYRSPNPEEYTQAIAELVEISS